MKRELKFTKMVAAGNDFILIDNRSKSAQQANLKLSLLAKNICNRKYGVGADGLLVLENSGRADFRMRIINPDGSEPKMCGNGIRCAVFYSAGRSRSKSGGMLNIETRAGNIHAVVNKGRVRFQITKPQNIKLGQTLKINKRAIKVNFINTGVPHVVIFTEGLDKIDVVSIGRQVRFHKRFLPEGTNVDFTQVIDENNIKIRTYERGVEDETLACGTGTVAAALITGLYLGSRACQTIDVRTQSRELLRVEFERINGGFKNVWLQGKAEIVYKGIFYQGPKPRPETGGY
ncbi:diaminopimelate epimerase [Candidatus Omnitrophota bacterium]